MIERKKVVQYTNIIDLSLKLHNDMAVYPSDPPINITQRSSMPDDSVNMLELNMSTHHGTHIDAPFHQLADGQSLDEFPPHKFVVGRTLKLDLAPEEADPNTNQKEGVLYRQLITAADLDTYTERLAWVEGVVLHTGYGRVLLKNRVDRDYPRLDIAAAEMLADFKNLKVIGIDSLSVDAMGEHKVHHIWFAEPDRWLVESMVCLDQLPLSFTLCCFPLLIENADGSPCRAIAFCD